MFSSALTPAFEKWSSPTSKTTRSTPLIWLERNRTLVSIDSRPSDALALALRIDCPIFVEDEVLKSSKSKDGGQDRIKDEDLRRLLENMPDEDLGRYKM